jgi:hypothetical protein
VRILLVEDRRRRRPLLSIARKLAKGLTRQGHDVVEVGYGDLLREFVLRAKARADRALASLAREVEPDLVLLALVKEVDAATLERLREAAGPRATLALHTADVRRGLDPRVEPLLPHLDWFLGTGGGAWLAAHARGGTRAAFLPNPCDPDVERPRDVEPRLRHDLLFTGKLRHGAPGQDPDRARVVERLVRERGLALYPGPAGSALGDRDYLRALAGAKLVLSMNAYDGVPLYHSDRLIHALGCGAFVLAKRVERGELLFEDGVHYRTFASEEECLALVDRFLDPAAEEERARIAAAGRARAVEMFEARRVAGWLVDLVARGRYDAPFADVFPAPAPEGTSGGEGSRGTASAGARPPAAVPAPRAGQA